jgi:tRNA-2-methylthio-N6-dimethylallyladenosine synthase
MLVQIETGHRRVTGLSLETEDTFEVPFTRRDNPHKAFLTIIEGCDKSCAYCVVPMTRGPERSRTSASVLDEARRLAAEGYTEITLLGQNVNSYRDPSPAGLDFAQLLRRIGQVDGLRRVRFTTSHPRDFVKDIIDAIDENPILCNHIHLPVQSGSTSILSRMQRLYTREEYLRHIDWMKNARRDIAITSDIIVGFPGETDADFEQTLRLLEEVRYDSIFSFKYSQRPNTPALQYEDHLTEEEKSRRLTIVQERQRQIQLERNANYVGAIEEVHIDGYNRATRQWLGKTSQHKQVCFTHPMLPEPASGGATLEGTYLPVRITRSGPVSLAGEAAVLPN